MATSPSRATAAVVGAAAAAATIAYALHHFGPLEEHALETVVAAIAIAMLIAAVPAALAAAASGLPELIVAAPGSHHVRAAGAADAHFCAALHAATLPHGFFTQLGPRFLRAYHRTFAESPHAVAFVATMADAPVGMLVGVLHPGAHARWVLRHRGIRHAVLGALGLGVRPLTGIRFLRTRARRYLTGWRRNRAPRSAPHASRDEPAILSHVAVLPGARGTGTGRQLVVAFVGALQAAGVRRATLVTLDTADGAGEFYARLGWRRGIARITPDGHRMIEWSLVVDPRCAE